MGNSVRDAPNIVVITCHDLGRFLGCYGITSVQTPRLDQLAADGVRFDSAFCAAPQCGPSRAALFSGRYPQSACFARAAAGGIPTFEGTLVDGSQHLARQLGHAGYRSVAIGVVHECYPCAGSSHDLADLNEIMATRCGFDEIIGFGGDGVDLEGSECTTLAIERLDRLAAADTPFYLQVGYTEPHRLWGDNDEPGTWGFLGNHLESDSELGVTVPPYLVDDADARVELAELQGAVRYVDAAIGRLLDHLRELGIENNTIVVFTADHGLSMPRAKMSLYDPGLEVALIVRYPRRGWTGGRVVSDLVSNVDVFPTLLAASGLPLSELLQGRDLTAVLDDQAHDRNTEIFAQQTSHCYYDPRRCVRTDGHKLIVHFSPGYGYMIEPIWRHRVTPKVSWWPPPPPVELYDLTQDPLETHNVAGEPAYEDVRRELLARLRQWMEAVRDPLLEGPVATWLHAMVLNELAAAGAPAVSAEAGHPQALELGDGRANGKEVGE